MSDTDTGKLIKNGKYGFRYKLLTIMKKVIAKTSTYPWLLALLVALFVSLLVTPRIGGSLGGFKIGEFVGHAIKADHDFDVEDVASTKQRQAEAAAAILPIYDHNAGAAPDMAKRLQEAFEAMRLFYASLSGRSESDGDQAVVGVISQSAVEEQKKRFASVLGIEMDKKTFNQLEREGFSKGEQEQLQDLVNYALTRLVVNDKQQLLDQVGLLPAEPAINLRELVSKRERAYNNIDNILDLPTVLAQVETRAQERVTSVQRRTTLLKMARQLIRPTIVYNLAATEERRAEAREKVGPSIIHFRRNQLIIAEGEELTEEHLLILQKMREGAGAANSLISFLAVTLLLFFAQIVLAVFGRANIRKFDVSNRDLAFLATVVGSTAFFAWLAKTIAEPLSDSFTWLTVDAVHYLFPIAAFAMIVRLLLYSEAALLLLCVTAPLSGLIVDGSIGYALLVLIASLVGAHRIGHAERRGKVVQAGLVVGGIASIVALAVQLVGDPATLVSIATPLNMLAAFLGGLLTGPFILAVLPLFEATFGYTSNLQLMELANLNHPLLERMMVEAPGTYHHSLVVSTLAEKGAESIGANPLLAKVAGLYHDVGKINKPQYFIENQYGGNPHDNLPPRMSSLILIAHVREGVDYARRYRLGERIENIIAQHHGTAQIRYFYKRAKENEGDGKEKVEEADFRYKGPKPQTKEAALVMLSDVVEAATRSLKTPTPARIESTVLELLNAVHGDGQLDECDMTLRDLHKIAAQFATILHGRYHGRIEYPTEGNSKRGNVVNLANQSAADEPHPAD